MYIEEPDYHGHIVGISSQEFDDILRKLDNITKYLHRQIEHHGLYDLNVVHLSDHGMASVKLDRIIDLTKYINSSDYKFVGTSPGLHIFPNSGMCTCLTSSNISKYSRKCALCISISFY